MRCIVLDGSESEVKHVLEDLGLAEKREERECATEGTSREDIAKEHQPEPKKVGRLMGSKTLLSRKNRLFARWNKAEDEYLVKNYHRQGKDALAIRLGRPISAIYARGKKLGVQKRLGERDGVRGPLVSHKTK